jgi:hypothetical protein
MTQRKNEPTREELELENMKTVARKLLQKQWNDTREGQVFRRVEDRVHMPRLYAALMADRDRFVEEHMNATLEDLYDEKDYLSNPNRYYGIPGGFL